MMLKVLGLALPTLLISSSVCPQVGSGPKLEPQTSQEGKIQQLAQDQNQPTIAEKIRVTGLEEQDVKPFFTAIQNAVRQNNAAALSRMVRYPLRLRYPKGRNVKVINSTEFIANYSKFAHQNWQRAVMEQRYEELFSNWQGLMIGNGEIWFNGICRNESCSERELKIIAINPTFAN
jgi:hypothetical protein